MTETTILGLVLILVLIMMIRVNNRLTELEIKNLEKEDKEAQWENGNSK